MTTQELINHQPGVSPMKTLDQLAIDIDTGVRPAEAIAAVLPTPLLVPKGMSLVPGKMYLRLYHGRTDPSQEMDDWGFVGPTFGSLSCYIHTYCCTFRIPGECHTSELWLERHDDMIRWDGCFYGDLEVFIAGTDDKA